MIIEALIGYKVIKDFKSIEKNYDIAAELNENAFLKLGEAKDRILQSKEIAENTLLKLCNRRESIFQSTMPYFVQVMAPLKKSKIIDQSDIAIYDLIVDTTCEFNKISTQLEIGKTRNSKNPDFTTFLLLGGPIYLMKKKKHSQEMVRQSKIFHKEAEVFEKHSETIVQYLDYITAQTSIMIELSLRLNILLIKCLKIFSKIVEINNDDKMKYSLEDRQLMKVCFNLMKILKDITSSTVFENDELSKVFLQSIKIGESELDKVNNIINEQQIFLAQNKIF